MSIYDFKQQQFHDAPVFAGDAGVVRGPTGYERALSSGLGASSASIVWERAPADPAGMGDNWHTGQWWTEQVAALRPVMPPPDLRRNI